MTIFRLVGDHRWLVGGPPWIGMVGDLDDHKISSVQNFRPLGALEPSNSLTDIGRDGGTFCVLSRVASQLKKSRFLSLKTLFP